VLSKTAELKIKFAQDSSEITKAIFGDETNYYTAKALQALSKAFLQKADITEA
jgi:hypothetical protein